MDEVEDYWERGRGAEMPRTTGIHHNLGIYGWDVRDALSRTSRRCAQSLSQPKDDWLAQMVEGANDRAALRTLPPFTDNGAPGMTPLDAAEALGKDGGIETMIVCLGGNNALRTVVDLRVVWSTAPEFQDLDAKSAFTIWDPDHFAIEFRELAARVARIDARHVIWATVPHVTIAPLARGVATKVAQGSRYFPFYTRPWIGNADFDDKDDPHITEQEARAVDSAIDQYNDVIVEVVRQARQAGRDWYVIDIRGLLDRAATRRYADDLSARPPW